MNRPTMEELRQLVGNQQGRYAGTPGRGPAGKTCRTCAWKTYGAAHKSKHPKCGKANWTHGDATTIRTSTPACQFYEEDS